MLPSQSSTTYSKVDTYTLSQSYPSGATAGPVMFLNSILRTGNDGATTKLPLVTFTAAEMDNASPGPRRRRLTGPGSRRSTPRTASRST